MAFCVISVVSKTNGSLISIHLVMIALEALKESLQSSFIHSGSRHIARLV